MSSFASWLDERRRRVDAACERLLPAPLGPARTVAAAMRYAVQAGGKRLRPLVAIAAHESCGGKGAELDEPAAALELIHTFSLVHDDLPAMDDDDLRRGRPTVHRAFGEAAAILAGDALLALAFESLARWPAGDSHAARRAIAVARVAARTGPAGMIGGQIGDLEAEAGAVSLERLDWIHRHKTGALFAAAAELGALHAGASSEVCQALSSYGEALGMAFQIADDVLDRTATAQELGKTPGKDERAGKATYPALAGLEAARAAALSWATRARAALEQRGLLTEPLERLARLAADRER
jgi:geranylgeranyl pyrophosphate synthase